MGKHLTSTWSMRGIDIETRRMFEMAARKRGLSIGRLADEVLRKAAAAILEEEGQFDPRIGAAVIDLSRRLEAVEAQLNDQPQQQSRVRRRTARRLEAQ